MRLTIQRQGNPPLWGGFIYAMSSSGGIDRAAVVLVSALIGSATLVQRVRRRRSVQRSKSRDCPALVEKQVRPNYNSNVAQAQCFFLAQYWPSLAVLWLLSCDMTLQAGILGNSMVMCGMDLDLAWYCRAQQTTRSGQIRPMERARRSRRTPWTWFCSRRSCRCLCQRYGTCSTARRFDKG